MVPFSLRPLTADDLDALVALDQDPEVMRYINGGTPTPRVVAEELLLRMLAQATAPGLGFFAVEASDGDFLGWMHLRLDSFEPAWAEIGYRLKRCARWRRKIGPCAPRTGRARGPGSW